MQIASHMEKFERLTALRARFDPLADFELWYWTTLAASTNALNVALHHCGATTPDRAFSTIPGMHVVPQPDGTWRRELRGPGDVSHVGWPPVDGPVPPDVESLMHAIERIEEKRDPCLRGDRAPSPAIVGECESAFEIVARLLRARLAGSAR